MYTQETNLNIVPSGVRPVIHCSQYDNNISAIKFSLYKDNVAFPVPSWAAVIINGQKPDKTGFSYAASAINGNVVTIDVTQQMTAIAGDVLCELRLRSNAQIIGTLNFILRVEPAPLNDETIISETEIPLIEQAVDIAANLAEYIQATYDNAAAAEASARAAAISATDAATDAASAASDAASVQELYDSIETAKQNANNAASAANAAAQEIEGLTAQATTLPAGSPATASLNNGVLTLGIPVGATGANGVTTEVSGMIAFSVDAAGNLYVHYNVNDDVADNFRYDAETGNLYYDIDEGA